MALFAEGHVQATGAEQAVPGLTVTFSFFLVGFVGLVFFREHGWGTWDRLRASAGRREILIGKLVPVAVVAALQIAVLFLVGWAGFGMRVKGSLLALGLLCAALPACPLALGLAVVAFARTLQQVNVMANLGTVVLAGLGGALVPVSLLPGWAGRLAPAFPTYWAMRGFRAVILDGHGVGAVLLPIGMLLAFAVVLTGLAVARFSFEASKVSWA